MTEKIVAAAMVYNGVTCSLPAPARHGDIIHAIAKSLGEEHWPINGEQGFLTSTGRFVGRGEACDIATAAEQAPVGLVKLFTEDLW